MTTLSSALRVLARLLAVMAAVLTFGVAMAWVWDRSDAPREAASLPAGLPGGR